MPQTPNHLAPPKSPNSVASFFFNTVHLLPKDLRFKHGGAKIFSCPRKHLTSVRPCHTVDSSQKSHVALAPELIFFGHNPRFMTIGKDRNKDRFEN